MVVVLTAPLTTGRRSSFGLASAMFAAFFTTGDYIICKTGLR